MPRSGQTFTVLTYHRVGDAGSGPPGIVSCTPEQFERHMRWLGRSGRAVALDALLRARTEGRPLPRGSVLVTFDDAYEDFRDEAWPVLRRHGVPVTLFVPTAFPDSDRRFWWDRLFAALRAAPRGCSTRRSGRLRSPRPTSRSPPTGVCASTSSRCRTTRRWRSSTGSWPSSGPSPRRAGVLGWAALRELAADGVALAAHSRTHPLLNRLPAERLEDEIAGSMADLRERAGAGTPAFVYPGGGCRPLRRGWSRRPARSSPSPPRSAATTPATPTGCGCGASTSGSARAGPRSCARASRSPAATGPPGAAEAGDATGAQADGGAPHVAYVTSRFPKLSETFVLTELLAVRRRGVRVDVHPLQRKREPVMHPEARGPAAEAYYEPLLSPAVLSSQLYWLRRRPARLPGHGAARAARHLGQPEVLRGRARVPPARRARRAAMQEAGVEHVHCHFAHHPTLAGFVIGRLTGIPYSFTAHGSDLHVDRTMLPQKVAEAAFVATISEDNRPAHHRHRGRALRRPRARHPRGRRHRPLRAAGERRPPARLAVGALRIVCVGTLHEVKGQRHLVEACRLLAGQGVDVRWRLIGDGEDRAMLEGAIAAAGLQERVELAGALTRDQVAAELAAADVSWRRASRPSRAGARASPSC
jgi:peptidoglycan/xylan/chitin deacetylase (PgdA/CDA1 family)/glycosyltransferase involved in cell wall biosynthesis